MAGSLLLLLALGGVLSVLFLRVRPVEQTVQKQLQGTWAATSMNIGLMPIPGPNAELTFKDDQMSLKTVQETSGSYRIDAGKDPMQLDWTVNGAVGHWIFKLNGDELTLAVMQGPDRPADFNPQAKKNVSIFKRR